MYLSVKCVKKKSRWSRKTTLWVSEDIYIYSMYVVCLKQYKNPLLYLCRHSVMFRPFTLCVKCPCNDITD